MWRRQANELWRENLTPYAWCFSFLEHVLFFATPLVGWEKHCWGKRGCRFTQCAKFSQAGEGQTECIPWGKNNCSIGIRKASYLLNSSFMLGSRNLTIWAHKVVFRVREVGIETWSRWQRCKSDPPRFLKGRTAWTELFVNVRRCLNFKTFVLIPDLVESASSPPSNRLHW